MANTFSTPAIVLNRLPVNEGDSRVILFTESNGLLDLLARGTGNLHSKMAAHLEPFNYLELMLIIGRNQNYVGSANSLNCWPILKVDYYKLTIAGQIVNFLLKVIKPQVIDRQLFIMLRQLLQLLNHQLIGYQSAIFAADCWMNQLFFHLGWGLNLQYCGQCQNILMGKKCFFSHRQGQIICSACASNSSDLLSVSDKTLNLINNIYRNGWLSILKNLEFNKILKKEIADLTRYQKFYYQEF